MVGAKRRRPLLDQSHLKEGLSRVFEDSASSEEEDVDLFIEKRHKKMVDEVNADLSDTEDEGNEPELKQREVLKLPDSDSESSDSEDDEREGEETKDWGGQRKNWYGGDTFEYEIMEDEERTEALKHEEEEAVRLQQKALSSMRPEDFLDEDEDEESEEEVDIFDARTQLLADGGSSEASARLLEVTAPEVPLLVKEMQQCYKEVAKWKQRVHWNETARLIYHLNVSLVTNVAFYLSLRTDPDAEGTDLRTHPVMVRIVRIRTLLKKALGLPCDEPKPTENGYNKMSTKTKKETRKRIDLVQTIVENKKDEALGKESEQQLNGHRDDSNMLSESTKKKRRKRKRKKKEASEADIAEDELHVESLLSSRNEFSETNIEDERDGKRRKLNKIVAQMERERKNSEGRKLPSADIEHVQEERKARPAVSIEDASAVPLEDDEEVMQKMLAKKAKKEARKARKEAANKAHVYTFNDEVDPASKRRASTDVIRNRGLTRYRPRDKKTPRTKNRAMYSKAVLRRKSAVRDYAGKSSGTYGGEASGINMSARKSSKLG